MIVIGDKNKFAFQLELDERFNQWPFGKFCIWLNGNMFGRYEEGCHLGSLLVLLEEVLENIELSEKVILPELDVEDFFYFCKYWLHDKFDKKGNIFEISINPPKTNLFLANPRIDIMNDVFIFRKITTSNNYSIVYRYNKRIYFLNISVNEYLFYYKKLIIELHFLMKEIKKI